MNNKKMKKLLITSTLSTAFLVSPIAMVSCGFNISKGDINLNDQLEMLGSDSAKIAVFNEWISNTFATLYVKNVLTTNDQEISNEEIKNKSNDILHYLRTLNWRSNTTTLTEDQKSKFETLVRNAYDFYIAFKSTVKESSDSAIDPSLYFITKAQEWKLKEYVYVPNKEDEDEDGELTLNGFNPSLNYLPPTNEVDDTNYKNDFKLLFKIRGTGVYSEVMKLLLGEIYFLHSDEEQIMKGTDYRKKTKKTTTKDYVDATSFDINDKDYFLVKYLVTKSPQFKWNYSSENQTNKIFIKEWKEFNNLSLINNKLNDWIAPETNDLATDKDFSLAKLNNYNGLILDTTSDAMDLSNSIDDIKMYGYEKVGLLDTENNVLHSFENLKSRNLIEQNKTNKKLPIIKLKNGSLDKSTREITLNDIEMSIDGSNTTIFNEKDNTLKLEDGDQSWTITKLSFPPSDSSTKKINLTVKYEFKVDTDTHEYWYNFDIQDWKNENGTPVQTTPFEKIYSFSNNSGSTEDAELSKKFPLSISIKNKENKNDISYILRVLPIFEPKAITDGAPSTIVINKTTYMLGKFSLENTPWQSEEEKRKLIYFFILNDSSLFTSIQDYWLFNNFNIRSGNSKTKEIISSLGLNEKTKADRKAAGIE